MSVLFNLQQDSQGNLIPTVGFDAYGMVVNPHIYTDNERACTIQLDVDHTHTKETYDGDNPLIIDFFNREPDHPSYGILAPDEERTINFTNGVKIQQLFRETFDFFKTNDESARIKSNLFNLIVTDLKLDNIPHILTDEEMVEIRNTFTEMRGEDIIIDEETMEYTIITTYGHERVEEWDDEYLMSSVDELFLFRLKDTEDKVDGWDTHQALGIIRNGVETSLKVKYRSLDRSDSFVFDIDENWEDMYKITITRITNPSKDADAVTITYQRVVIQ